MPRPDPAALHPPPLRPIRVRGLDDTRIAAAVADRLGVALTLMADGAGGPLWLLGLLERTRRAHPGLEATALLDCGDRAGEAQGALAAGVPLVLFSGRTDAAIRLAAIAAARGAVLLTRRPPLLDLAAADLTEGGSRRRHAALEALCRDWLSRAQG